MKKDILLSTTNSIPNYDVIESRGLVFANVVLGTNFFSDFAASFTDTFGGTSDTYQSKLDKIYSEVINKLKVKVTDLGCNAIIGFKIDFDEMVKHDYDPYLYDEDDEDVFYPTDTGEILLLLIG